MKSLKKIIKRVVISIGGLILFSILLLITGLFLWGNTEHLKIQIEQRFQEKTGQTLLIKGDVNWIFFPHLGVRLHQVQVDHPLNFDQRSFVNIKTVDVLPRWQSLLKERPQVQTIFLNDLSFTIPALLPKIDIPITIRGNFVFKAPQQTLETENLIIKIDQLQIIGQVTVHHILKKPEFKGHLAIDHLDLSDWLKTVIRSAVIDFQMNDTFSGKFSFDQLKIDRFDCHQLKGDISAQRGLLQLSNMKGQLEGGHIDGNLTLDQFQPFPRYRINLNLSDVELSQLLASDWLHGPANVVFNGRMKGIPNASILHSLNGSVKVSANHGTVNNDKLFKPLKAIRRWIKIPVETKFSEFTATGDIKEGILTNQDLFLKSELLRIGGKGVINLTNSTLNYRFFLLDYGLSILLNGDMNHPKIEADISSLKKPQISDILKIKL